MNYNTFRFGFSDLNLNLFQIRELLGYNDQMTSDMITDMATGIYEECKSLSDIRAEYRIYDGISISEKERSIKIGKLVFYTGKIVIGQMKRTESIAVFLCTAGKEIGVHSRRLMKEGDMLKGYVYDVIGTQIVEAATDRMQELLKNNMIIRGMKITNRFSPGYCGWDVAEQHKLFKLMPENFCGIRLTESALMDPVKSVSGFIGLGMNVRFNPYTCSICDRINCLYRKADT